MIAQNFDSNIDSLSYTDKRQIQQDINISIKQLEETKGIPLEKVLTDIRNEYGQLS